MTCLNGVLVTFSAGISFVSAEFVFAVCAAKAAVGTLPKTFGIPVSDVFPYRKFDDRYAEQRKRKKTRDERQHSIAQEMIPSGYTARDAAAVFHQIFLQRAEEKHTEDIKEITKAPERNKLSRPDQLCQLQC